jgi:hypothetical protein
MRSTAPHGVDDPTFYLSAIDVLRAERVDFLVGGAFAMRVHAGVERDTKDFDVFVRPRDVDRVIEVFRKAGFCAGHVFSHWLSKVHGEGQFLDVIFRAGNGLCDVDDEWFAFACEAEFFRTRLRVCPPEEMIWQKAFIMERERFDGADVQHLLRSCGHRMDWERILRRFGEDWPVLLCHLVLFDYVYPSERASVPGSVLQRLAAMLDSRDSSGKRICRGTLLSRLQYLDDIERWGYEDARTEPRVRISPAELRQWTEEAKEQASYLSEKILHAGDR